MGIVVLTHRLKIKKNCKHQTGSHMQMCKNSKMLVRLQEQGAMYILDIVNTNYYVDIGEYDDYVHKIIYNILIYILFVIGNYTYISVI